MQHKKKQPRPIVPVHAVLGPQHAAGAGKPKLQLAGKPKVQHAGKPPQHKAGKPQLQQARKPQLQQAGEPPRQQQKQPGLANGHAKPQAQAQPAGGGIKRPGSQSPGAEQPAAKKQHQEQHPHPKHAQQLQRPASHPQGQQVQRQQTQQQPQQQPVQRAAQPQPARGAAAAGSKARHKRSNKRKQPQPAGAGNGGSSEPGAGPLGKGAPSKAAAAALLVGKPWRAKQPADLSTNWAALRQQLAQQDAAKPRRRRKGSEGAPAGAGAAATRGISSSGHNKAATPTIAMDCEMVGVGPKGERDSLARVSIVNASGNVLLDSYVAQKEAVTDYRTWVSGIQPAHLVGAPGLEEVQARVAQLLEGRTLVGHGLSKDLRVLLLSHPRKAIRDTAKFPPFMFSKGGKRRPRALRQLALQELGLTIQEGEHSSVDDARAALYLYQKHAATWERALKAPDGLKSLPTANRPGAGSGSKKKRRVESYAARELRDDPLADL